MKNIFFVSSARFSPSKWRHQPRRALCQIVFFLTILASTHAQTTVLLNTGPRQTTLAGTGNDASTSSGAASSATFGAPRSVAYDIQNNLYILDSRNNQLTRITPDGQLTIVAGTGQEGYAGDNGPASQAMLNRPAALLVDSDGTILLADTGNHCIRSIAPDGTISTIAGTGTPGNTGDGSPALAGRLRSPAGIARDSDGTLLIADSGNHRIRRITSSGAIEAVAGNGKEGDAGDGGPASSATFLHPSALLLLPDHRVLVADSAAHRIRALSPDGQIAAFNAASFRRPQGMALDAAGSLVIADADLQQLLQTANGGYSVLAGNTKQGASNTGSLNSPSAAARDTTGGIAIADSGNHQVQHIALPSLDFGSVPAGKQSAAQPLSLKNSGDTPLQITAVTLAFPFQLATGSTCAATPFTLAANAACSLQIAFAPQAQGAAKVIGLVQTTTTPPGTLLLTGTGSAGTNLATSTTALTSNGSISYAGAPVQLTATVTGSLLTAPTGNITFQDGTNTLTTAAINASTTSLSTSALTTGQHTLRAIYSGDAAYASSTSSTITQTVVAAPDFSISTPASSYSGSASGTVTIPVSVLPLNGTLNHAASIAISGLPTGATATFLPSTFTLAGDPVAITLLIKVPATLASNRPNAMGWIAAAFLLSIVPFKRKHRAVLLTLVMLSIQGCGGFRATSISTGSSSTTHRYTCTLSATTTGVLHDTLTHSIPLELDLTQ